MDTIKLYTIGFTQKSAQEFFDLLKSAGVRRIVDVRLNVTSQLAGFAKQKDLKYFLEAILGADYLHLKNAAPEKTLLEGYKKKEISWAEYEKAYRKLLETRKAWEWLPDTLSSGDCFLCSEHEPDQCHRRLLAEYFAEIIDAVEVHHLV